MSNNLEQKKLRLLKRNPQFEQHGVILRDSQTKQLIFVTEDEIKHLFHSEWVAIPNGLKVTNRNLFVEKDLEASPAC